LLKTDEHRFFRLASLANYVLFIRHVKYRAKDCSVRTTLEPHNVSVIIKIKTKNLCHMERESWG